MFDFNIYYKCACIIDSDGHTIIPQGKSCRHFMREDYEASKFVYNWEDNVGDEGNKYLQLGINFVLSSHFEYETAVNDKDKSSKDNKKNKNKQRRKERSFNESNESKESKDSVENEDRQRPTRGNTMTEDDLEDSQVRDNIRESDFYESTHEMSESESKGDNNMERRKNAILENDIKIDDKNSEWKTETDKEREREKEKDRDTEKNEKESVQENEAKNKDNKDNNDPQLKEKHFSVKRVFLPLDLPLLHFWFYPKKEGSERPENLIKRTIMQTQVNNAEEDSSQHSSFFNGSILNEFRAFGGAIGETIKQALPSMSDITEVEPQVPASLANGTIGNQGTPQSLAHTISNSHSHSHSNSHSNSHSFSRTHTISQVSHSGSMSQSRDSTQLSRESQRQLQQLALSQSQIGLVDSSIRGIGGIGGIGGGDNTPNGIPTRRESTGGSGTSGRKRGKIIRNLMTRSNTNTKTKTKTKTKKLIKKKDYHPSRDDVELDKRVMVFEELANHKITENCVLQIQDYYRNYDPRPYYEYLLKVTDRSGVNNETKVEWRIHTRFSKIKSFDKAIRRNKALKSKRIPKFPSDIYVGNLDKKKVEQRVNDLKQYFSGLCMIKEALFTTQFKHFVIPPCIIDEYCKESPEANNNDNKLLDSPPNHTSPSLQSKGPTEGPPPVPPMPSYLLPNTSTGSNTRHPSVPAKISLPPLDSNDFIIYPLHMRVRRHSIPGAVPDKHYRKPPSMAGDWRWENGYEHLQSMFSDAHILVSDSEIDTTVTTTTATATAITTKRRRRNQYSTDNETDDDDDIDDDDDNDRDGDNSSSTDSLGSDAIDDILSPMGNVNGKSPDSKGQTENNSPTKTITANDTENEKKEKEKEKDKDKEMEKEKDKEEEQAYSRSEIMRKYARLTPAISGLIEAFLDLEKRNWMGASMTITATRIFRWFFDGAIKTYLHSQMVSWTGSDSLAAVIDYLRETIWPRGTLCESAPPVEESDKLEAAVNAREIIDDIATYLLPDYISRMIGRSHVKSCLVKFYRFLQQEMLVKHLFFTVMDSLLSDLFPENVSRHAARIRQYTEEKQKEEKKLKEQRELEHQQQQHKQQQIERRQQIQKQRQLHAQYQQLQQLQRHPPRSSGARYGYTPIHQAHHHHHQYQYQQPPHIAHQYFNIRNNVNMNNNNQIENGQSQQSQQPPPPPKVNDYDNNSGMKDYGPMSAHESFINLNRDRQNGTANVNAKHRRVHSLQQQQQQYSQPPPPKQPKHGRQLRSGNRSVSSKELLGKRKFGDSTSSGYDDVSGVGIASRPPTQQPPPPPRRMKTYDASSAADMAQQQQQQQQNKSGKSSRFRGMFAGYKSQSQSGNGNGNGNGNDIAKRGNMVRGHSGTGDDRSSYIQNGQIITSRTGAPQYKVNSKHSHSLQDTNEKERIDRKHLTPRDGTINGTTITSIPNGNTNGTVNGSSNGNTNTNTNHSKTPTGASSSSSTNNHNGNTNSNPSPSTAQYQNIRRPSDFFFRNNKQDGTNGNTSGWAYANNPNNNGNSNNNNLNGKNSINNGNNSNNTSNNNSGYGGYAASHAASHAYTNGTMNPINPSIGVGHHGTHNGMFGNGNSRIGYRYHNKEYYQAQLPKQRQFAGDYSSGEEFDGDASESDIWAQNDYEQQVNRIKLQKQKQKQERERRERIQRQIENNRNGEQRLSQTRARSRAIASPTNENRNRNRNRNGNHDGEWRQTKRSHDLNNRGAGGGGENDCGIFSDSDDEDEISLAQVRQEEEEAAEEHRKKMAANDSTSFVGNLFTKVADTLEVVGSSFTAETMAGDAKMERFYH